MIPKDPIILLSYINTQLRDHYASLKDLCRSLDADQDHIVETLGNVDYDYNPDHNQFETHWGKYPH
ncbi:MAG: DUF4250 domain-containing protein [Lachnospiraceae bacterium]|nr:DUF4250 domain-containing protein [Lachnospiraceae bacterium]